MTNEITINNDDKEKYQSIKLIDKVDDYLLIKFDDNSCFLTNGAKIIKLKQNYSLLNVIDYNDTYYGLNGSQIININTGEVLLTDSSIESIYKEDNETIYVNRYGKPNTLFSIITNCYLPVPDNYEFEQNLDNHLYSYCEKNYNKDFHDLDRIIISSDGKVLFKNIEKGHIQNYENNIIINSDNAIIILKDNNKIKVPKNDSAKYYNGNIYIIEKNQIKVLDLDLNVVKNIAVPNLDFVYDWEITGGIIKLQLPGIIDGKDLCNFLFINLTNEKKLLHRRIEAIPYFTPDFYIGFDNLKSYEYENWKIEKPKEKNTYHFYDKEFNKIMEISGNEYDDLNEGKIIIFNHTQSGWKKSFVNLHECVIKDCPYDNIHFDTETQIGYGYNENTGMIDIFDQYLNPLFTNIDYKKYNIDKQKIKIAYQVINNTLIFQIQHDRHVLRNIIFDENNNVLFNSTNHFCKPLGNLIQIRKFNDYDDNSIYLNTLTGEMGTLHISQSDNRLNLVIDDQKIKKLLLD